MHSCVCETLLLNTLQILILYAVTLNSLLDRGLPYICSEIKM